MNGVDLVNRDELSASQQRELQRYIDANAHLLGFLDKEREEKDATDPGGVYKGGTYSTPSLGSLAGAAAAAGAAKAAESGANADRAGTNGENADSLASPRRQYQSYSLGRAPLLSSYEDSSSAYARPPSATQSLNRMGAGSPSSEYGYGGPGKRKGVSWSDVVDPSPVPGRARSNSPPNISSFRNSVGELTIAKNTNFRVTLVTPWPSLMIHNTAVTIDTPRWHATEVLRIPRLTNKGCVWELQIVPKNSNIPTDF